MLELDSSVAARACESADVSDSLADQPALPGREAGAVVDTASPPRGRSAELRCRSLAPLPPHASRFPRDPVLTGPGPHIFTGPGPVNPVRAGNYFAEPTSTE